MMPQLVPQRVPALLTVVEIAAAAVGRLKRDVTVKQAQARFDLITRQLQQAYPERWRERRDRDR